MKTIMAKEIFLLLHFATGLLAGAFLLGTIGLRPVLNCLPDSIHIRVRQAIIPTFRRVLLPLMLISIAATGFLVWIESRSWVAWFAFGLAIAMPILTLAVNVPINNMIAGWSSETLPNDWRKHVTRWNYADAARLALSLATFISSEIIS